MIDQKEKKTLVSSHSPQITREEKDDYCGMEWNAFPPLLNNSNNKTYNHFISPCSVPLYSFPSIHVFYTNAASDDPHIVLYTVIQFSFKHNASGETREWTSWQRLQNNPREKKNSFANQKKLQ